MNHRDTAAAPCTLSTTAQLQPRKKMHSGLQANEFDTAYR